MWYENKIRHKIISGLYNLKITDVEKVIIIYAPVNLKCQENERKIKNKVHIFEKKYMYVIWKKRKGFG